MTMAMGRGVRAATALVGQRRPPAVTQGRAAEGCGGRHYVFIGVRNLSSPGRSLVGCRGAGCRCELSSQFTNRPGLVLGG
jgi:hypothetical protein